MWLVCFLQTPTSTGITDSKNISCLVKLFSNYLDSIWIFVNMRRLCQVLQTCGIMSTSVPGDDKVWKAERWTWRGIVGWKWRQATSRWTAQDPRVSFEPSAPQPQDLRRYGASGPLNRSPGIARFSAEAAPYGFPCVSERSTANRSTSQHNASGSPEERLPVSSATPMTASERGATLSFAGNGSFPTGKAGGGWGGTRAYCCMRPRPGPPLLWSCSAHFLCSLILPLKKQMI